MFLSCFLTYFFFFFNDTATTEIYTLSLHDALPISIISVNLALLNLLPVPMLDGGHLFFFVIEAVMGRPLSLKKREAAQQLGFVLLMLLMVYALYNDLVRIDAFRMFK